MLADHPKVLEVAAVGVRRSSGIVKVFIVKKDKSLTEREIIDFSENLTGHKVPKLVEFRDELPKECGQNPT